MVILSFDIEEHYRIEAAAGLTFPDDVKRDYAARMETTTRRLLAQLAAAGAKATFFIVGEIARSHPKLIADIAAAGHEVGAHGWDHRRVHHFTPAEFLEDVRRCKEALEQASGQAVAGYRAPTFSVMHETAWAIDALAEAGYRYDSSVFPVRHDRYGVPAAPRTPFLIEGRERTILELPPATYRVLGQNLPVAGGGYFRLFPLSFLVAGGAATDEARSGGWDAVLPSVGVRPGTATLATEAVVALSHIRRRRPQHGATRAIVAAISGALSPSDRCRGGVGIAPRDVAYVSIGGTESEPKSVRTRAMLNPRAYARRLAILLWAPPPSTAPSPGSDR